MFKHELLKQYPLKRIDTQNGRFYQNEQGQQFESVTSILSKLNYESLQKWRDKVGEDKAKKISTQASRRGTAIHDLCEKYLLNQDYKKGTMPFNLDNFKQIKPYLDSNVGTIYGIELMMYSTKYNCAGTTDLICDWKGEKSIVDFKTSRYKKTEDKIQGYFLQSSVYAQMVNELYNIQIPKLVIIMSVDHEGVLLFEKKVDTYKNQLHDVFIRNR